MTPNVFLDSSQYIYEKNVDPLSRIALFMKFLAFLPSKTNRFRELHQTKLRQPIKDAGAQNN